MDTIDKRYSKFRHVIHFIKKNKTHLIILFFVILSSILFIFFFVVIFPSKSKLFKKNTTPLSTTNNQQIKDIKEKNPIFTSTPSVIKINWLDQPKTIPNPKIFKETGLFISSDEITTIYFNKMVSRLVGKSTNGLEIINIIVPIDDLYFGLKNAKEVCNFIRSPDGQIFTLNQEQPHCHLIEEHLLSEINQSDIYIKELDPPDNFQTKDLVFYSKFLEDRTIDQLINPKIIEPTEYGNFYVVYNVRKDIEDIYKRSFYLELKDKTLYRYDLDPVGNNASYIYPKNSLIYWSDGDLSNTTYFFEPSMDKCNYGYNIIKDKSTLLKYKVEVGTINQSKIYQIKDINNPLNKKIFNLYQQYISEESNNTALSINDFVNIKNHFLYQDKLDDWIIYIDQNYIHELDTMNNCPTREDQFIY